MNIDDILILAKAGFTAEQITALAAASQPATPAPVSTPPAEPEPEPAVPIEEVNQNPTPAPDPMDKLSAMISAGFEELSKKMVGSINPSIGDIKPHGIDDIITNFFKED